MRPATLFTENTIQYTTDGAYKHLSIAETILSGGYDAGTEGYLLAADFSLYPFLLAIGILFGKGSLGPLIAGVVCSVISVWLISSFFWRWAVDENSTLSKVTAVMALPFLILSVGGATYALGGTWSALVILATIMVLVNIPRLKPDTTPPWALVAGTIAGPLISVSGAFLFLVATVAIFMAGHRRLALAIVAVQSAVLGLYLYCMMRLNIPVTAMAAVSPFKNLSMSELLVPDDLLKMLGGRWGSISIFMATLVILLNRHSEKHFSRRIMAITFLAVTGAFVLFGERGITFRREYQTMVILTVAMTYLFSNELKGFGKKWGGALCIAFLSLYLSWPLTIQALQTPLRSARVFDLHFRSHQFSAQIFPYPVAAYEVGRYSFENPNSVFDLRNFSAEPQNRPPEERDSVNTIKEVLENLGNDPEIVYAIVNAAVLDVPLAKETRWCVVARLTNERFDRALTAYYFLLNRPEMESEMQAALDKFSSVLPEYAKLERGACL